MTRVCWSTACSSSSLVHGWHGVVEGWQNGDCAEDKMVDDEGEAEGPVDEGGEDGPGEEGGHGGGARHGEGGPARAAWGGGVSQTRRNHGRCQGLEGWGVT